VAIANGRGKGEERRAPKRNKRKKIRRLALPSKEKAGEPAYPSRRERGKGEGKRSDRPGVEGAETTFIIPEKD